MESRAQQLLHDWQEFRLDIEKKVAENLEYPHYAEGAYKTDLVQALAFWIFFKSGAVELSVEERREFLCSMDLGEGNMFLQIVFQIEMLPVMVFRKILWKHNIDFMSLESFLRRLTTEQVSAIQQNFADLFYRGIVPRIFGKMEKFFRGVAVKKLLSEKENSDVRYSRKASWSYNLLGLDFGFNAFPKGIADNTKVVEISPLRFLSTKNHEDDFVVNQENGKYWWFYRTARSNYVINSEKNVQLKKHICPGFWWTFFVHLIFWIISPIFLATFYPFACYARGFDSEILGFCSSIAYGLVAAITLMWVVVACAKFVCCKASCKLFGEKKRKWPIKIINVTVDCVILCLAVAAITLVVLAFREFYLFLCPAFGRVASAGIVFGIVYYLIIQSIEGMNVPWNLDDKNAKYWLPLTVVACGIIAKFILVYGALIVPFMWKCLLVVFFWAKQIMERYWIMLVPMIFLFVVPIVFVGCAHYANKKWDRKRQEKFFDVLDKIFFWSILPLLVAYIGVIAIYANSIAVFVALVGAIAFLGLAWWLINISSPSVYDARMLTKRMEKDHLGSINYRLLLKNEWFKSLTENEKWKVMLSIKKFVSKIFTKEEWRLGYELIIPNVTSELLELLKQSLEIIDCERTEVRKLFLRELICGKSIEEAIKIAREKMKISEKRRECIANLIQYVVDPVCGFFRKIIEIVITVVRLYELFNKRCPYVTQQGTVKTNTD